MKSYWISHLTEYSQSIEPLNEIFPGGGFLLQGNIKMFGSIGIALAMYHTAKPEKRKKVGALLFAAALTAVFAGITEPLEFTFLFIAPYLFAIHAILGATMVTIMHGFGLVGNMGGGLIEIAATNWVPLMGNHWGVYVAQFIIGFIFIIVYYYTFKFLILKFDIPMPGREKNSNGGTKLYTKKDYQISKEQTDAARTADFEQYDNEYDRKAAVYLEGLGGAKNIEDVTNCATRLRVTVVDPNTVRDDTYFKEYGEAHGVVRNNKSIQVIVGLSVPQIRDSIEVLINEAKN